MPTLPAPRFVFPPPERQLYVHDLLNRSRQTVLHAAVANAATQVNAALLRTEITQYAPAPGLSALQGTGVRDEMVFAVPSLLTHTPSTLGYYRLLLGVSQKQFYTTSTGLRPFEPMERENRMSPAAQSALGAFCMGINEAISDLVQGIPSGSLSRDIEQLPLMSLGSQADGSWRNQIGQRATKGVFEALKAVIKSRNVTYTDLGDTLEVVNASGRTVTLALAADPDVVIREEVNSQTLVKAAIEIKGGVDYSNVHNRAGEAEKSHQKARARNAQDFWTVISLARVDRTQLAAESPTTRQWFDVEEVLANAGPDWQRLLNATISAMGI